MNKDKASLLFVAAIALLVGLSVGYVLGSWQSASRTVEEHPKISDRNRSASSNLTSISATPAKSQRSSASSTSLCPVDDVASGTARARPEIQIPASWPPGKRIVIQVTRSLTQSYALACDVPVPAWNYLQRGHQVTIVVDGEAATAFRRDSTGQSPLDRLDMLSTDLDGLTARLEMPVPAVPKNFGELYRVLASRGIRIIANEDALRALRIEPAELDTIVTVVSGAEVRKITTDLDAFLPYSG